MTSKVKKLMTPHVVTIKGSTPFTEACRMFKTFGIHHLPVTDNSNKFIGMFSATDALEAYDRLFSTTLTSIEKEVNEKIRISEIMSSHQLYSLNEDDDIRTVMKFFKEYKIHAVPILKNEKVVGILTSNDILKALSPEQIVL
jgi:CBS domain-containing membrane protein